MSDDAMKLFEARLGRCQAASALETSDRVPISPCMNYFAESYSGFSKQQILYDMDACMQAEQRFARDFPEVDVLRTNRLWAPLYDAVGYKLFKLPGRDLPPDVQYQFVEDEYMKADEYRLMIDDPNTFVLERYLPRILSEFGERGSSRSYMAFVKAGLAQGHFAALQARRMVKLETELGMPVSTSGKTLAPFDLLADGFRGLKGAMLDMFRQPANVIEACDALVPKAVSCGLAGADPLRRYPIFIPTHKACFLTPKQFEKFYWPSLKKTMLELIEEGYQVRLLLEGNWMPHWHYLLEMPKGSLVCDLDNENDIFRAKAEIGHHVCLVGGMPDSTLILGTPEEVRERVKLLCETVGKDGGFMISGGSGIPYTTKPENFRAMVDAVMEYGWYDRAVTPQPKAVPQPKASSRATDHQILTPWSVKRAELGGVMGDEALIQKSWDMLETMAHTWMWVWPQC